jgi:hypothetical protein
VLRAWAPLLALAAPAATAAAQGPEARGPEAQGPEAVVRAIDGRTWQGRVTIAADGAAHVKPGRGEPVTLKLDELSGIDQTAGQPTVGRATAGSRAWLRSGGEVAVTRIDGVASQKDQVELALEVGPVVRLPLRSLSALRLDQGKAAVPSFAADRDAPPENSDYLYVEKDGKPQRFSVTVDHLAPGQVHFDLHGTAYDFGLTGVTGVVFGRNTGFAPDRQPRPRAQVRFANGDRLEGRLVSLGGELELRLDEGAVLKVDRARVLRIDMQSDRLVWLGELKPKIEQTPAFDRTWPPTFDRSPLGPGIRLGGQQFTRGFVAVPRARLTFDLDGRFDAFEATIGIDDRSGPQANAIARVVADGKVLYESPPLVLGNAPQQVRVEIGRCRQLALEVDFGKNYDLGDFCAFADARVVQL